MSLPQLVIFIGAVTAALGAFWASYREEHEKVRSANEKAKFEKELREKSEEQLELLKGIYSLLAQGKITVEDARRVFPGVFSESLNLQENLDKKIVPGTKQNP